MDKVINTGVLFMRNLLHLNVAVIENEEREEFALPSPYTQDWENQLVWEIMDAAKENSVSFLNDSFLSYYCLIHLTDVVVLIGPYRQHTMTRAEARRRLTEERFEENTVDQYLKWYNSQPLQEMSVVKLAAHSMIVSVYGSAKDTEERTVNIQRYEQSHHLIPTDLSQDMASTDSLIFNELSFPYMMHIRAGNYEGAVATYNNMMRYTKPHKNFAIIDTVEGVTNIRTLTRIATQQAGVPVTAAQAILEEFKGKVRMAGSKSEVMKLTYKMISDICILVRQYKRTSYSVSISLAVDYIHRNLSRPLAVADIAGEVGLSPNRLSTKFHQEVGESITQYISRHRLEEAVNLLMYTNLTIQEICAQVGILDNNYFARRFKKAYGVAPVQYRKQHGESAKGGE